MLEVPSRGSLSHNTGLFSAYPLQTMGQEQQAALAPVEAGVESALDTAADGTVGGDTVWQFAALAGAGKPWADPVIAAGLTAIQATADKSHFVSVMVDAGRTLGRSCCCLLSILIAPVGITYSTAPQPR